MAGLDYRAFIFGSLMIRDIHDCSGGVQHTLYVDLK